MLKSILNEFGSFMSVKETKTSSFSFKVLTKYTVNIFIVCITLISFQQYFGQSIDCITDKKDHKEELELKCWTEGSYVIRDQLFTGVVGKNVSTYGVGSCKPQDHPKCDRLHQRHYQWVVPILALQAILFYFPRILWRHMENGVMEKLLCDIESPVVNDQWQAKKTYLIKFLTEFSKSYHRVYILKYVVCEILSGIALIFNILITHWVFNNFWTEFEPAILALLNSNVEMFLRNSAKIFPYQAKCTLYMYGGSGSIQEIDGLCFLPQNVISEKIFVFLYFWFILLCFVAIINFIIILFLLTFKFLRVRDLRRMSEHFYNRRQHSFFSYYADIGYWFVLHLIHKNLSPVLYRDFVNDLMHSREKFVKKDFKEEHDEEYMTSTSFS